LLDLADLVLLLGADRGMDNRLELRSDVVVTKYAGAKKTSADTSVFQQDATPEYFHNAIVRCLAGL
jgi:hypothetical protein